MKFQITNSKSQINSKLQILSSQRVWNFGNWNLGIVWDLVLGIWNFSSRNSAKKGIALLLTVVLLSAILSVGIGIFNIMFAQTLLSGEISQSFVAFMAADHAVEKTLYRDRRMPGEVCPNVIITQGSEMPSCFSETVSDLRALPGWSGYHFACYTVTATKEDLDSDGGIETTITAVGQFRCGANPLLFVKRAYEAFYEAPPVQCADGIDNDGDTLIDYPADPQCSSFTDNDEAF